MVQLNELQTADLLDEIASAMEYESPVIDSLTRLTERRFGRVSKAAIFLTGRLERGESLGSSLSQLSTPCPPQLAAAIRAAELSGNPTLLTTFAQQLRERYNLRGETRLIWFYPCLLTLVAYLAFVQSMAPLIRSSDGPTIAWSAVVLQLAHWVQSNWWLPLLIVAIIALLARYLLPRSTRLPALRLQSLFFSTLATQLEAGAPEHEALQNAALMASETDLAASESLSFSTPRVQELLSPTGPCLAASVADPANLIMLTANLRQLAFVLNRKADRQQTFWHQIMPQVATFVVGATLLLSLVWFVLAPVYRELTTW